MRKLLHLPHRSELAVLEAAEIERTLEHFLLPARVRSLPNGEVVGAISKVRSLSL